MMMLHMTHGWYIMDIRLTVSFMTSVSQCFLTRRKLRMISCEGVLYAE